MENIPEDEGAIKVNVFDKNNPSNPDVSYTSLDDIKDGICTPAEYSITILCPKSFTDEDRKPHEYDKPTAQYVYGDAIFPSNCKIMDGTDPDTGDPVYVVTIYQSATDFLSSDKKLHLTIKYNEIEVPPID